MKKTILTLFSLVSFASASFAQMSAFKDSYTLDYSTANAANCLSNNVPNNGGITANGGFFADASASTYASLAGITVVTQTVGSTGNPFNMFDFPFTSGSGPSAICSSYRADASSGLTFNTQSNAKVRLYIKASTNGTVVRFWLGHSGGASGFYPANSTYNTGSNNNSFIKEFTIGTATTFVDIDYTADDAAQWTAWTGKNDIDLWGLTYQGATDNVTVTVSKILFGSALVITGNTSANVVNDQVTLAPNPANGSFNVDMTAMANSEAASVKVINANGVVVKEFTTNNNEELISTEGMNKGIYIVRVTSANKVASKKVVVE